MTDLTAHGIHLVDAIPILKRQLDSMATMVRNQGFDTGGLPDTGIPERELEAGRRPTEEGGDI